MAETGNSFLSEPTLALAYQNAFNDIANSESYVQYPQVQAAYNAALVAYFNGLDAGLSPIEAVVPATASTGPIAITTPNGTAAATFSFIVE